MSALDIRGNPVGTSSAAALASCEMALWRTMTFFDTPLADLDAAIAADPGWLLPRLMKAGFLLSLTEPGLHAQAALWLADAAALQEAAPPRERAHWAALCAVRDGRWEQACTIWDQLLIEQPRDALALQWAQMWDFYRGDAPELRLRPARALPEWDADDPLLPCVLALHAFGLGECNLHAQAEDVGRRAVALSARVPWATHAVAHAMETQGRHEEGAAWLRSQQDHWADGNLLAAHLWWHVGLFRLEVLDYPGVWRLIDSHLSLTALRFTPQRVDAAALLWRLHLLGQDVSLAMRDLSQAWNLDAAQAGFHAFNDVHALLALLGAGQTARAEAWIAACAARAMQPQDARRANHQVAREVGLPLMRALLALTRGEPDAAAALYAVRHQAQRLGGSQDQRDIIDQSLLAAACAGGSAARLGRAVLNERLLAKPATPLSRHWSQRLGVRENLPQT